MNRIYSLIWSAARGCFVAAAENTKGHGKNSKPGLGLVGAVLFGASVLSAGSAQAQVSVTVENPGVRLSTSTFSSAALETFNAQTVSASTQTLSSVFSSSVGTASSLFNASGITIGNVIVGNADIFGGASAAGTGTTSNYGRYAKNYSGGVSNYNITVNLGSSLNYFGIDMEAVNNGNNVALYSGTTLVYNFSTNDLMNLIGSNNAYKSPNGDFWAYVNFYGGNGTTFDKVILNGNYFESDNYIVGSYTTASGASVTGPTLTVPDIVAAGNANGSNINLASTILNGASANYNNRFDGGTLKVDAAGTYAGNFSITSNGGAIDQGGLASTFTGVFSNDTTDTSSSARNLTITNSGTAGVGAVTLTAVNTYTGATTVDAGAKLALSGAGSVATSSGVTANGVFDITDTTSGASIKSLSGSGSVVTASGKSLSLTSASGTFSGVIGGAGGVNLSSGTETLSGANTYTGATNINGGTLNLTGSLASTAVTVAGGTLTNASGGLAAGTNLTVNSGAVNINANDSIANLNGTGGSVALASGKTLSVSAGGTYAGALSGAGSVQIAGGTQVLSGTNTHSGGTEVDAGATLSIASASALGSGTLALVGTSSVSATLKTTASMTIANAITVKNDPTFDVVSNTTTTVSGVIADGGAAGYVTKIGAGTLALTAANTYTGPTTISAGTLALSGSGAIAGSTSVTNNATLDVTATSDNVAIKNYTQASGATLKMNISGDPTSNQKVNVTGTTSLGGTLNLVAASGSYRPAKYTLMTSTGALSGTFSTLSTNLASVTRYDYSLGYDANNVYLYLRSNAADTMASIRAMGADLNKVYNAQYGVAQLGLTYDCRLFDANDLCLSTGARTTHSRADGSTYDGVALIAAYRAQPKLRVGGWVDQNESSQMAMNVTAGNSTPMFGAFAVWNENPETRTGLEFKLSGAYGQKDLTLTRPLVGTSEHGQGSSKLSTMVAEASVAYGIALDARMSIAPFTSLRYASLSNKGYTEGSNVFTPLTFAKTSQSAKSVIAGVKLYDKPEGPIGLDLSAGVERYVSTSAAQISASGLDGLSAVQMTPVLSKNRPFASASLRYEIDKTQHLLFGLSHSKHFTNSDWVTSATVRYVIGL